MPKITDYPAKTNLSDDDIFVVSTADATYSCSFAIIKRALNGIKLNYTATDTGSKISKAELVVGTTEAELTSGTPYTIPSTYYTSGVKFKLTFASSASGTITISGGVTAEETFTDATDPVEVTLDLTSVTSDIVVAVSAE